MCLRLRLCPKASVYTGVEQSHRKSRGEMMTDAGGFIWTGLVVME